VTIGVENKKLWITDYWARAKEEKAFRVLAIFGATTALQ
jgi:hypothetical protein